MKPKTNNNCLLTITVVLFAGGALDASAQTWQTVLDYLQLPGYGAAGWSGAAADSLGNVFLGGEAVDASNIDHGLVLKTDTTAATWYLSGDLVPSPPYTAVKVFGLGFDASGNLYQAGGLLAPCTPSSCPGDLWFISKSADRGQTWRTVDTFQYAPNDQSQWPRSFAGDSSGKVFICGDWRDARDTSHFLVRKSNGGEPGTWSAVD